MLRKVNSLVLYQVAPWFQGGPTYTASAPTRDQAVKMVVRFWGRRARFVRLPTRLVWRKVTRYRHDGSKQVTREAFELDKAIEDKVLAKLASARRRSARGRRFLTHQEVWSKKAVQKRRPESGKRKS